MGGCGACPRPACLARYRASCKSFRKLTLASSACYPVLGSMGRSALGFGVFLAVYNGVSCSSEVLRRKTDVVNSLVVARGLRDLSVFRSRCACLCPPRWAVWLQEALPGFAVGTPEP